MRKHAKFSTKNNFSLNDLPFFAGNSKKTKIGRFDFLIYLKKNWISFLISPSSVVRGKY